MFLISSSNVLFQILQVSGESAPADVAQISGDSCDGLVGAEGSFFVLVKACLSLFDLQHSWYHFCQCQNKILWLTIIQPPVVSFVVVVGVSVQI